MHPEIADSLIGYLLGKASLKTRFLFCSAVLGRTEPTLFTI